MVVVEALAAGTPVLGSALGGIMEWVVDGRNGWLVPHGDVHAWSAVIGKLATEGVGVTITSSARSMGDVAAEMHSLYRELTGVEPMPA